MDNIGTGDIVMWTILAIGIVYGAFQVPHTWRNIKQDLWSNKFKNWVLVLSVYALAIVSIDYIVATSPHYFLSDGGRWLLAIPLTIIIVFLYSKVSKRFSL